MNKNDKILLAKEINRHIAAHSATIWPGFTAIPYILYDDQNQVASGTKWPARYIQAPGEENIWVAEGTDAQLMGNSSIPYHGMQVAIWDTRTWPENPAVSMAAGCIAHEMFHVFQQTQMELLWPNELLLPQYPHSPHSVALVLAENRLLVDILTQLDKKDKQDKKDNQDKNDNQDKKDNQDKIVKNAIGMCLKRIAVLRKQRETEIGPAYFAYDKHCESCEGTAAYVEMRMAANAAEKALTEVAATYHLTLLTDSSRLLTNYRHRCYVAGLVLCLAADVLLPGWQVKWAKSKASLYDWMMNEPALAEPEETKKGVAVFPSDVPITHDDLAKARLCLSAFQQDNERKISTFLAQPLISIDGPIQLLTFDPMNLTCAGGFCLHKHGKIRFGDSTQILETPFLTEYGDTILAIKRVFMLSDHTPIRNLFETYKA